MLIIVIVVLVIVYIIASLLGAVTPINFYDTPPLPPAEPFRPNICQRVLIMTKSFWIAIALGAFVSALATPASAQSCRELRQACLMKDSLGERGQGNCRLFRERCGGGGGGINRCEQLRRACMFKDERGEVGQGNCRRFRAECP